MSHISQEKLETLISYEANLDCANTKLSTVSVCNDFPENLNQTIEHFEKLDSTDTGNRIDKELQRFSLMNNPNVLVKNYNQINCKSKSMVNVSKATNLKDEHEHKFTSLSHSRSLPQMLNDLPPKEIDDLFATFRSILNRSDTTIVRRPLFQLGDSFEENSCDELQNEFLADDEYSDQLAKKLLKVLNLEKSPSKSLSTSCPAIPSPEHQISKRSLDEIDGQSICSDSELILPENKRHRTRVFTDLSDSDVSPGSMEYDSEDDSVVLATNRSANEEDNSLRSFGILPALLSSQVRERSFLVGGLTKHQSLLGTNELHRYFPDRTLRLFVGTWNMQRKGIPRNLDDFLLPKHEQYVQDMYVVGVQESTQDQDKWEIKLQETLGPNYVLAHSVAHGVLHIAVLMRRDLIWFCSPFENDKVTTRMVSQIKTKGAVAVAFNFFGTSMLFVSAHFHSGETRCKERIDDFCKISEKLRLPKQNSKYSSLKDNVTDRYDCVFWFGDLNFRVNRPREIMHQEIQDPINYDFREVLKGDQLSAMMRKGRVFHGFNEAKISFLPTYKFNPGSNEYDSTKQRVPSYTDRILSKSKEPNSITCSKYDSVPAIKKSDHRPVYALFDVSLKPGRISGVGSGQFRHDVYQKAARLRANTLNQSQSAVCNIL